MKFFLAILLFFPIACATAVEVCDIDSSRYFISQWAEEGEPIQMLSKVDGPRFSVERVKVVYSDDLNDDGVRDFIFSHVGSEGSSKNRVYGFFIQCRGYLRFVGGDYFAGVKVLDASLGDKNKYKKIEIYSYQRDRDGGVLYKGQEALTKSHVWSFNQSAQRYEGESE
ncbi:hypothetical protein DNK59_01570 [Pseudomonas sp. TKO26]|uniref:hypothetical protein n=1 Tax=unclassified Pseudomonas TaxID=196821 RepID=UPI000D8862F8|nr:MULTISPECIES: hypothetical protein [unclassified Pseudomonas]PYY92263.1 hypothetical protein DNK62_01570 [Pseudomonas sp. TKO30]PYY94626.1 hypothetical protein DNK61_01570 [Pseudomonas sp. TKO29]PYY96499.1 hypothetical protein DNK59_01570 [Pseudomonas sp. TKO26]PYZ02091.1 hypothetical protein DNK60_01570 [Pseudomonas sp. TKO14]